MNFINKTIGRLLTAGMTMAFFGLVFAVLLQVFARLFLTKAPNWTEEASRFLLVWMVGFGGGLAMRDRGYVNVDLLINLFSPRVKTILVSGIDLLIAGFMCIFLHQAWVNTLRQGRRQTSPALFIPMQYIYFALVVLGAGVIIFSMAAFIINLRKSFGKRPNGESPESDANPV